MYQGKDLNMSGIQNRAQARRCTLFKITIKTIGEKKIFLITIKTIGEEKKNYRRRECLEKESLVWENRTENRIAGGENIWVWGAGRSL